MHQSPVGSLQGVLPTPSGDPRARFPGSPPLSSGGPLPARPPLLSSERRARCLPRSGTRRTPPWPRQGEPSLSSSSFSSSRPTPDSGRSRPRPLLGGPGLAGPAPPRPRPALAPSLAAAAGAMASPRCPRPLRTGGAGPAFIASARLPQAPLCSH